MLQARALATADKYISSSLPKYCEKIFILASLYEFHSSHLFPMENRVSFFDRRGNLGILPIKRNILQLSRLSIYKHIVNIIVS